MIKKILYCWILTLAFVDFCYSYNCDLEEIRSRFFEISQSGKGVKEFLNYYQKPTNKDPISQAYIAAATMMQAREVKNPFSKMKYFYNGKEKLEDLIQKHPTYIELRFIRFCIQTNIPSVLKYNNIEVDKNLLLAQLHQTKNQKNVDLQKYMIKYLLSTKFVTALEKQEIRKI